MATLPLRSLEDGKRRLAHRLAAAQRRQLILYLCGVVVHALRDSGIVDMIALVSGDDLALRYAQSLGLAPIREEEQELNGALGTAGDWAAARADAHLIVLPDLPLLRPTDLVALARSGRHRPGIVVCPDRAWTGTNILMSHPCGAIPPLFGPDSFARHLHAARTAGLPVTIYDSPGTRWDIDTPDDLDALGLDR